MITTEHKKWPKNGQNCVDPQSQLFRLLMLQRVSRRYKGHQISEKFDTNEEGKFNLL